jgi:hypothetical protein
MCQEEKEGMIELAEGLSNGRVPRCATTAFTASNHDPLKLATSLPHVTLARAHADSRHRKIRASRYASYRELS